MKRQQGTNNCAELNNDAQCFNFSPNLNKPYLYLRIMLYSSLNISWFPNLGTAGWFCLCF